MNHIKPPNPELGVSQHLNIVLYNLPRKKDAKATFLSLTKH